jgi:hypothetical protein
MNGGSMTTLSRVSMAAAAALLVGLSPAAAADLGGGCCADLEERVAELEATTARKGTRKVSLTISGQISQQLMFWDDGNKSDTYFSGPGTSNSRWRMTGSARISPEVSAGFLYEFEAFASSSASQNQTLGSAPPSNTISGGTGADAGSTSANLREAMAWLEHSRLGRVSLGQGLTAAGNVILVDLSGKGMAASNDVRLHSSGMRLFSRDLHNITGNGYLNSGTWGGFFQGSSGDWLNERIEHIQYRTPAIAGFTLGASWGEDDYWDAALRYAGEFNGIRLAGALGYSVRSGYEGTPGDLFCSSECNKKMEQLAGSLSIRHMPTGLFFTGAAGWRDMKNQDTVAASTLLPTDDDIGIQQGEKRANYEASFFYLSGGVARNFFGIGDTVLYGEYSQWKGAGQDTEFTGVIPQAYTFTETNDVQIHTYGGAGSKLTHWGVGIVQHVDAAAMEFWVAYKNYSLSGFELQTLQRPNIGKFEDLHLITAGTRIRF